MLEAAFVGIGWAAAGLLSDGVGATAVSCEIKAAAPHDPESLKRAEDADATLRRVLTPDEFSQLLRPDSIFKLESISDEERFLGTARIVDRQPTAKGSTGSIKVSLTDGRRSHAAHMTTIDVYQPLWKGKDGSQERLFSKYIDPKNNTADRRWFDFDLPIGVTREQDIAVKLVTLPGPRGDITSDHAGWSELHIVY